MNDFAISADGVPIHYEVHGDGQTALIFVHGGLGNRSLWEKQADYFAPRYKVVTVDLAGHGESGLNRNDWTILAWSEDVVAVADKIGLEQIVLIGHSFSDRVILEAARKMPERVIGLVSVDGYFDDIEGTLSSGIISEDRIEEIITPFRADFFNEMLKIRQFQFPNADPALAEKILEIASKVPPEVGIGTFYAIFRHDLNLALLQEVKAPIVAINSDFHPNDIESAQKYGIEIIVMSGFDHFPMMEDAQNFNLLLETTVDRFVHQ